MKRISILLTGLGFIALSIISCDDEKVLTIEKKVDHGKGAIVSNEGAWGNANASISFYSFEKDSMTNNIFKTVNGRDLGDVLQSAFIKNDSTYLILNGSNKVEVITTDSFKSVATYNDLKMPRYMAIANNWAYITQWVDYTALKGSVAVVDVKKNTIVTNIQVGLGPEGIIELNGKIWVANSGGLGLDSTVMVIDPFNNNVVKTIQVGYCPLKLIADKNGDVWVLCGNTIYNPDFTIKKAAESKLVKISGINFSVTKEIKISETLHPTTLDINNTKDILYYGAGYGFAGIWAVSINATTITTQPIINKSVYGFSVNKLNGEIYACMAPSFSDAGVLIRYSALGDSIKSYNVGIGPNGVAFK